MKTTAVTTLLLSLTSVGIPAFAQPSQEAAENEPVASTLPAAFRRHILPEELDQLDHRELREAMQRYWQTGDAAVITRGNAVVFPFGKSQPEVRCTPLRACDIELQTGEVITGVALGDTERWVTSPLETGAAASPTPHVIVKPTQWDLVTNLVIGTDRRTYHLALLSPPKEQSGEAGYYRHVSFYYPQDLVDYWFTERSRRRAKVASRATATTAEVSALSVSELNFDYTLKGARKVPWAPVTVFDDGRHVYIQLPEAVRSTDLPALLVKVQGGGMAIVNYRVRDTWFIVDGLFERAELVVGVGRKRKKVEIINRSPIRGGA